MRSLWNATSFVAVVNLLALAMFAGWLWQSERLSRERIDMVRELFAVTIPQEEQEQHERERAEAEVQRQAEAERRRIDPPAASADQLERISRIEAQEMQIERRLADERDVILEQLERRAAAIESAQRAFETEKQAWADQIEAELRRRQDEQFIKTVKLLQGLPPKRAKQQLTVMIEDGRIGQAVAYLDAMELRVAGRILGEFKSDTDNRLATELLERLRTFGLDASSSEETAHDVQSADPRDPAALGAATD